MARRLGSPVRGSVSASSLTENLVIQPTYRALAYGIMAKRLEIDFELKADNSDSAALKMRNLEVPLRASRE